MMENSEGFEMSLDEVLEKALFELQHISLKICIEKQICFIEQALDSAAFLFTGYKSNEQKRHFEIDLKTELNALMSNLGYIPLITLPSGFDKLGLYWKGIFYVSSAINKADNMIIYYDNLSIEEKIKEFTKINTFLSNALGVMIDLLENLNENVH